MAFNSQRSATNLVTIRAFFGAIRVHSIDEETSEIYGRIKASILDRWGPREKAKRRHTTAGQLGFSDNDLWIAAIAQRRGLIVVSSDTDFARVAEVTDLRHETWMSVS